MEVDPTRPIVRRPWSEWLFIGPWIGSRSQGSERKLSAVIPDKRGKGSADEFPHDTLPAIYEIARQPGDPDEPDPPAEAVARLPGGDGEVVYVGRTTGPTQGVRRRLEDHFAYGDNLTDKIDNSADKADALYARYIQFEKDDGMREAIRLERELWDMLGPLGRYSWNKNRPGL